ncbi:cytochrome b5 domain-containing protein 1-like [Mytilus californianus]|uniref:Cytochrome b5 domain-containing protein 1 n=1 Tax=Mytilus coruscus TaxID=42192 RepID=A0A6J8D081_MYTCO|nr:cytochrome b5 domain-containing protein 1-like [Mytilus californianus]CAC5401231.1 Cytochrome b5 domain-containing protein 1 [Mytilus coruscus]
MGRPKYFTPKEVAVHNTVDDLWVSFLGKVYNLTPLCEKYKGDVLLKPIIQAAGGDISHWFNPKTKDIRTHVDPQTGCEIPYCPNGRFVHIPPPYPDSNWANDFGRPWWKDDSYLVGILSQKTRKVKIINTLTSQDHVIEVCSEEIMTEILERYLKYNAHAASYTWKYDSRNLVMGSTLEENGIEDEDEEFYKLSMNDDTFLQAIHLYFNDDLTEA